MDDGRWAIYANNGQSTYRVTHHDDEFEARLFARLHQERYGEVTTVIFERKRKGKVKRNA